MAFLFVVHVPYEAPKSNKPAFGKEDVDSEENELNTDKVIVDLNTVSEEDEAKTDSLLDNGWVESEESLVKTGESEVKDLVADGKETASETLLATVNEVAPNPEVKDSLGFTVKENSDANKFVEGTATDETAQQPKLSEHPLQKSVETTVEDSHPSKDDNETNALSKVSEQNDLEVASDGSQDKTNTGSPHKVSEQTDDETASETVAGSTKTFEVVAVGESNVDSQTEPDKKVDTSSCGEEKTDNSENSELEDAKTVGSVKDVVGDVGNTEEDEEVKAIEEKYLTPLVQVTPVYKQVLNVLESSEVENVSLQKVADDKLYRISFVKEDSKNCEDILNKLKGLGVGRKPGSSISVFPTSVHESLTKEEAEESSTPVDEKEPSVEAQEKESKFKKSIKSRLIVQQVVDSVKGNAEFTFDYLLLIILASLIACMGLVENSSVVLVASMLISPLMGPILAGTFGHVIKVYELRNLGVKSELKGLLLCLVIGFLFGLVSGGLGLHGAVWGSSDSWPTIEMKSRGMLRSLWVGVLIAVPSGAGVAIGILGGNAGSLVGVAISASLLPPAVNAGMLWAYGLLAAIKPPAVIEPVITTVITTASTILSNITTAVNSTTTYTNTTAPSSSAIPVMTSPLPVTSIPESCPFLVNNEYRPVYSCNFSHDAALLGLVSLFLTILNITCIFFMGVLVLKVKEVAPNTAATTTDKNFWHDDVKVARTYYQTTKNLGKNFLADWRKFKEEQRPKQVTEEQKELQQNVETISCYNFISDLENDPTVRKIMARVSPSDSRLEWYRDLASEYEQAKQRVDEQYRKDPAIYLARYQPKARNKKVENAYHTIHHVSPGVGKPSLAELRGRFRKGQSLYFEGGQGHSDSDIPVSPKKKRVGFALLSPTQNKLFKRRKSKAEETEMEEGQKLI